MRSILFAVLGLTLLTPDYASAQIFRGGRGQGYGGSGWGVGYSDGNFGVGYQSGGYGRGYGYGDGYGYGGYGRGYGYGNPGYGYGGYGSGVNLGYSDGNFGIGLSTGGYGRGYYGNSYPYGSYGYGGYGSGMAYSNPSYGMYGTSGAYMGSPDMSGNVYQAGYGAGMNMANVVRLEVIVPDDNTELMIQGQRVGGSGRHRSFVSPALEAGKEYIYTVSIRSAQAREGAETTKKVDVKAGGQFTVDFTSGASGTERIPAPVPGIDNERRRDIDRDRDVNRDRSTDRPNTDKPNTDKPNTDRPRNDTPPAPGGEPTPPRI